MAILRIHFKDGRTMQIKGGSSEEYKEIAYHIRKNQLSNKIYVLDMPHVETGERPEIDLENLELMEVIEEL